MHTARQVLAASLFALALGACASGHRVPFESGIGARTTGGAPPAAIPRALEPTLGPETLTLQRAPSYQNYRVYRLEGPSQGDNRQPGNLITGSYYRAPGSATRPLVVLLPIWGVSTYPRQTTLRRLLNGPYGELIDVVTIDGRNRLFDWTGMRTAKSSRQFLAALTRSVHTYETTVADVRRVLRWAARQPDVDPARIGLVGYSMSAVTAVTLMAAEPRLRAAALVMAGGSLADAMLTCPWRPARVRRNVLATTGWSLDRYRREVEARVASIEPLAAAPAVDPARVLFVDAARDGCLGAEGREELWRALGRPARLVLPQNHYLAFLTMTFLGGHSTTKQVGDFLERRLFETTPAPTPRVALAGVE